MTISRGGTFSIKVEAIRRFVSDGIGRLGGESRRSELDESAAQDWRPIWGTNDSSVV
jgi:hypothetical protein